MTMTLYSYIDTVNGALFFKTKTLAEGRIRNKKPDYEYFRVDCL